MTTSTGANGAAEKTEILQCGKCHAKMCFPCGTAWHPGQTCDEASTASLQAFLAHTASTSSHGREDGSHSLEIKSCPSCREGLQRDEGCNFVRCPRCRAEICWICLSPYTEYHFSWWNLRGCPLLHLQSCSWAGDDRCCGCGCGRWMGRVKRMMLRVFLFLIYTLAFLLLLPLLILLSPYLLYRFSADQPRRHERQEMKRRQRRMEQAQKERAGMRSTEKPLEKPALPLAVV
jgi:hypothetical protein